MEGSRLLDDAIEALALLPGIGKKSAMRLALNILKWDKEEVDAFVGAIQNMRNGVKYCKQCNNISDKELCWICEDKKRDIATICIVEDLRDVLAIERTAQYKGLYHVLGGIIDPIEGVGPEDIDLDNLFKRIESAEVKEIILALPSSIEGDTTAFFISKNINSENLVISQIARGVAFGEDLEYTDVLTLGRSILDRKPL